MDNAVLSEQKILDWMLNKKTWRNWDDYNEVYEAIKSGQFNIPNPLQQQVEDMKQALEHYADRHNHPPFWLHDDGERARQALKSLTPTTEPNKEGEENEDLV